MLRWDDKLHEFVEKSLCKRHQDHLENDTYLFVKHLIFIDENEKRSLHKKIRHEIFDRSYIANYHSDEEFEVEDESDFDDEFYDVEIRK
jgi:hypothetical protein